MTALKMTVDEALALAEGWAAGMTFDAKSDGPFTCLLALAEEVRRLREREAGLLEQHSRDSAELRRVCAERDEARADERTAMGYLAQVRRVVGGEDFPDMVRRIERLRADAERYRWLLQECYRWPPAGRVCSREDQTEPVAIWTTFEGDDVDAAIDAAMEASNDN